MGLVKCSGCGRMVSDRLETCFQCGSHVVSSKNDPSDFKCYFCEQSTGKTKDAMMELLRNAPLEESACDNCGIELGYVLSVFQAERWMGYLCEQFPKIGIAVEELLDVVKNLPSSCEEIDIIKPLGNITRSLAVIADRDYYRAKYYKEASEDERRYFDRLGNLTHVYETIDDMIYNAYRAVEESDEGMNICYYKKHSLGNVVNLYLKDIIGKHNYFLEHGTRAKMSRDELKREITYIVRDANHFLTRITELMEKYSEGVEIYIDLCKKNLFNG